MVSICLLLFSASPFGKGGLRGISNPQIPPHPPFLKGGKRGYEKMFDARYRQFFVNDDSLSA
jgi:hypothetical protein